MTIDCSLDWPEISSITGPCIRPGGTVLTEQALKTCDLPLDSSILDIGCGAGGTLRYLERTGKYRSAGLDCSEPLIEEAGRRLKRVCLVRGRAENLPFKNGCVDGLLCECVLSTLKDKMDALLEFGRVLREGGFLIVSDVFDTRSLPLQPKLEEASAAIAEEGLLTRDSYWSLLEGLGLSLLLWEEHTRFLKEFVARMILAGQCLPESWLCGKEQKVEKTKGSRIGYFLLVARKQKQPLPT